MQSKKGFTLLEILLVIGIIAILAGIVIVAINPSKQLAQVRNSQRKSDIKQIYNAMTQYYIDNTYYPDSANLSTTTLTEVCNTGSVSNTSTSTTGVNCATAGLTNLSTLVPTYLTSIPTDPSGASSTLSFIPTAYAATAGTGYKIMRTTYNQVIAQAALAELGVPVAIGNVSLSVSRPLNISGLVAHYLMNDTNGTTIVDIKGGYTGTGTYTAVTGLINGASSFNGANYISTNVSISSDFSISFWVKRAAGFEDGVIMGSGNYGNFAGGVDINYQDTKRIMLVSQANNSQDIYETVETDLLTEGVWKLVTITKSGSTPHIYVDGVEKSGRYLMGSSMRSPQAKTPFVIGSWGNLYNYGWLQGLLDDVRVYNKALSLSEVVQIYNGGNGTDAE